MTKPIKRDSFIFYKSFHDATRDLPDDVRLRVFDAILLYAIDGEKVELSGIENAIFTLITPQLDANNKRFKNGKNGGRPKTYQEKPKRNQGVTKTKPNVNENENVNENVNVNVNVNETAFYEYNKIAEKIGIPIAQKLTNTRKSKLNARLKDCGGIEGWQIALQKLEQSSFLRGSTGWTASLDFLLQEKSFTKLMEGNYDDKPNQIKSKGNADDELEKFLARPRS